MFTSLPMRRSYRTMLVWLQPRCKCVQTRSNEHSHIESDCNDRGFLRRGEDLSSATTWPVAPAHSIDSNFVAALFASSRFNVFDSGGDLFRLAATVCVSSGVRRLADRGFGIRRYLFRFSQFDLRTAFGLGLQCVWLT